MTNIIDELESISAQLSEFLKSDNCRETKLKIDFCGKIIQDFHISWSGSWIGYHANVYYKDFS